MKEAILGKARMVGNGTITGGNYESIRIIGDSDVLGDVSCGLFACTGNCSIQGTIASNRFKMQGEVGVRGNWIGDELKALGQLTVDGGVRGRELTVTGSLIVRQYLEAERLAFKGAIIIDGLMNAEQADIRLYGPSRIRELGGRRIDVRPSKWVAVKQWLTPRAHSRLAAEVIEGDDIYLEQTKAAIVRGNRVYLGAGCDIGRVEYRQSLHVARGARVKEEMQL